MNAPSGFGTPAGTRDMRPFLAIANVDRALFEKARRVVGDTQSPYGAALALESWFRSTGGFKYTTPPPQSRSDPLLDFVLHTKRGYCQHFAGAMALMLRYLGIPARVAEGFVSGTYDAIRTPGRSPTTTRTRGSRSGSRGYGWLPFDPTPGRGFLSAGYSVSSPQFHAAAAASFVGGVAASRLNTAALHQDVSFGDKDVTFAGTDIRPAKPVAGRSVRAPASRRQPRQAARAPACARGRARRGRQGGSQAPALRDAGSSRPGGGMPRRPA